MQIVKALDLTGLAVFVGVLSKQKKRKGWRYSYMVLSPRGQRCSEHKIKIPYRCIKEIDRQPGRNQYIYLINKSHMDVREFDGIFRSV